MDAKSSSAEIAPPYGVAWRLRGSMMVLLPLILWIWLCWDWPIRLGFYSDDWMILLHPFVGTSKAFHDIALLVATRPLSAPFIWLAQVIVDWSPARSQLFNAAMLLVTAVSAGTLAAALASVSRGLRDGALAGACVASAAFIVFPSNVGTFAWGVGVIAVVPATPLFCFAMSLLLDSEGRPWQLGLGFALALMSHLSYEAFYFQEVTIVLTAAALRGSSIREIPWRVLIGAVLINIACIAFNRLTPGVIQKSFNWNFLQIFMGGYPRILDIFAHATREHDVLIGRSVVGAFLFGSICLARAVGLVRLTFALLVMICGIVAAGFLYASAGYGLAAEGPAARVSIVIATYLSIVAGVLAAAVWSVGRSYRWPAIAFCLCGIVALAALGQTARSRVKEWADTWTYETERLSRLPAAIVPAHDQHRIYIAIDDRTPSFVEPATAPWEIVGAVAWASYKVTNSRLSMVDIWRLPPLGYQWFATPHDWFSRWDGKNFEQGPCNGGTAYRAIAPELWSWRTSTDTLTKIEAPWKLGCQ